MGLFLQKNRSLFLDWIHFVPSGFDHLLWINGSFRWYRTSELYSYTYLDPYLPVNSGH